MKPSPPSRDSAIARCDSVTVSIAALTRGIFSEISRVTHVRVSVWFGKTPLREGTSRTSSKVKPSGMTSGIICSLHDSNRVLNALRSRKLHVLGFRKRVDDYRCDHEKCRIECQRRAEASAVGDRSNRVRSQGAQPSS